MEKRLFAAWNNFTRHQFNCQKRNRWLDVFLGTMLERQQETTNIPQFFRGMASVLTELFLNDISRIDLSPSSSPMDGDREKLDYCLRQRGWLLLHAMVSSNLRSSTGAAELTDLLIRLYETPVDSDLSISTSSTTLPSWPLSDLAAIISRTDLKTSKSKLRVRHSRSSPAVTDGAPANCPEEESSEEECRCCRNGDDSLPDDVALPCLPSESFHHLVLSLLEQLTGHHGNARLKSARHLDQRVLQFALHRLEQCATAASSAEEPRRLLRLILRAMVSLVQHRRPLAAEQVIQQLIDVAATCECPSLTAEVMEGLFRFLASVHPSDDKVHFQQWLSSFHSQTGVRLVLSAFPENADAQWIPLVGTIILNVTGRARIIPCHHHHVYGHPLTDPQHIDSQSCSISSMFFILLQAYSIGDEHVQKAALKSMTRAPPCCCLPPDLVFRILFERVLEAPEFLNLVEVVFHGVGFASTTSAETHCHFCRNNGGQELERCRQMGVYASTEALSQTAGKGAQADPWRSFDIIAGYILDRMDCPFSLSMMRHLAQRIVPEGTAHVQSEMWSRIFYPVLALPSSSGRGVQPDRSLVSGQITEISWRMTSSLVRQRNISELFLNSDGLELLMDYCRSPEWSSNVASVLNSMILAHFQLSSNAPDLLESVEGKPISMGTEVTALSTLEHLLLKYTHKVLTRLKPSTEEAEESVGPLRTTSALWRTVVRLLVRSHSFAAWFQHHALAVWIDQVMQILCQHLSDPAAEHWNLYFDLLETFITLSFLTSPADPRLGALLSHFSPGRNLPQLYDAVLRCATLERWISASNKNLADDEALRAKADGYEADDEPVELPSSSFRPCLFFPAVVGQLLLNFASWWDRATSEEDKAVMSRGFSASFTRMEALCAHPSTAAVLNQLGLLDLLLRDMKPILVHSDIHSEALRHQLLGMISCLGRRSLTPAQLRMMLELFKDEGPPWNELLPVLLNWIKHDVNQPTHFLSFPARQVPDEEDSIQLSGGSLGSFVQLNDIRWEIFTLAKNAKDLGRLHESKGIGSAWSNAAIFLPILADHNWDMQVDGVSLSMWSFLSDAIGTERFNSGTLPEFRPDLLDWAGVGLPMLDGPCESRNLHLFSVGTRSFLIEFWADASAEKTLLVRLSQSNHSDSQVLAMQTVDLKVPTGRWNHWVVNCRQKCTGCYRVVKIQIILNGYTSASVEIKSPMPTVKRLGNNHSFLLLGTVAGPKDQSPRRWRSMSPAWYLGHTTIYKGDFISAELALLLMALGPDGGVFLTSCLDGMLMPNFPRYIHPKLVSRIPFWDQIFEPDKLMESLQSKILLTYSAHSPESVFLYPCIISPAAGLMGSVLLPTSYAFNAVSVDPRCSQQPPISLSVAMAAPLSSHVHAGVRSALKELGGQSVLLFLLGHAIESGADGSSQARALEVLLQWLRSDAQEKLLFASNRGPWMLQYVFEVERCRPGKELASVLLDLSCSGPVIHKTGGHSDAVVVDPDLLAFTIQCWKHWQRYPDNSTGEEQQHSTLDFVLRALQHLLRDNHPHRQFNVRQMERANVLSVLLHMGRECSLYQECCPLTEHQSAQVADLVEGLLGSPPDMKSLTAVVEYLLLLHPAALTYASGSTAHFLLSNRDGVLGADLFQRRDWKLPDGFETYASEASNIQPMNANRLGSALRDVIVKWSDGVESSIKKSCSIQNGLESSNGTINRRSNGLSSSIRAEADATLSLHLMRILTACIRVLPDSMVKSVVGGILRPDLVLVMVRHQRDKMRAAAIRLLQALLARSEEEEQNFIRNSGLLLLASQLQPYVATHAVVEACLSLCVGVDVVLEQVTDPFTIWPEDPSPFQLQSTIVLLSLLPNAALDPALFHQLATLIRILATSNSILKFLLDFGLVETLAKSIVALAHANKHRPDDVLEQREDEILLEAIHRILILITTRTVNASGAGPWSVFQDMIQLFNYLERVEGGLCGPRAWCVRTLRDSTCIILKQAIQTVQLRAEFQLHMGSHPLLFLQQPGTSHFQHITDRVLSLVLPPSLNRKLKLDKPTGQSEITERFRCLLGKAVDQVALNAELNYSPVEIAFSQEILLTLVRGLSSTLERPRTPSGNSAARNNWSPDTSVDWSHYHPPDSADPSRTLFWNSRQALKTQLNRMLLFLSSPVQDPSFLFFVIRTLHDDPRHEELFRLIPANESDFTYKLDTYLCHFLHTRNCTDDVEHSTLIRIHCISRCLIPYYPRRKYQVLDPEELKQQLDNERKSWWRSQEEAQSRILARYDPLVKQTVETASRMTRQAVEAQHEIRQAFLDRLRRDHGSKVGAVDSWATLVERMTHQRAVWHFSRSYLGGWQLDPTEGYQRMRLRLERCALQMEAKYLLERSRILLEPESLPQPLEHILAHANSASVIEDIGREKILRLASCHVVTTTMEEPAELLLTKGWMTFLPTKLIHGRIEYDDVREVLCRRFVLQDRAFELFLADRRTVFVVLESAEERNAIVRQLHDLCTKLIPSENLAEVTQLWRENQITNFEYLVFLNKMAGRSFNDLMQYPIFPFVLADYESSVLDLDDPGVYRNFKKPMAVQKDHRDHHYIENYNYLKRDFENRLDGSGPNFGPFHYGSLYSNPGIVLHFLVRLPPFTKLLMEYQDRNFDVPDRSFHSIGTSWRLASSDSTTDVKELIPEFFYLPEFLVNALGFDFGMQQSGDAVDDVQLPPWCQGKPRLFIQIHRQALESSWVRDHLHHWIDLIFGFKQTGPAAVESINVFHPSTYAGFDAGNGPKDGVNEDPIERSAKLTMIRSYGQVPRQLFRQPHPMSIQPLNAKSVRRSASLLPSVEHLQWGSYVGSPACQDPVLKYKECFTVPVRSFLPLQTGDTYALGPFTAAIVSHSYDKDSFLGRPTGILGVGLVLWGQSDGIVRIKIRKDEPIKPLFLSEAHDSVVLCSTAPDYNKIWVAYRSGTIRVYPFAFDPLQSHFELTGPPAVLTGHTGSIQQLVLSADFSVAVSAGSDGSCILWDLHRLNFIRQFTPGKENATPVMQLAVSRNTADIACAVHLTGEKSLLELRSVNGALIGSVTTSPLITSLCFSSAPEGVSVNVVAAGLSNGHIRLWDSWTLHLLRDITTDSALSIVGLAYSSSSQHLLAARIDGTLLAWDSPGNVKKASRYPPFINLTLQ